MNSFTLSLLFALLATAILIAFIAWRLGRQLRRVRGRFFDSAGVQIHYTVQGEGEPVLLLHGFVMNIDINWRNFGIIDNLAQDYKVIAMDLRGHGLSGKPHDAKAYGLNFIEDVTRLLNHLDIEKIHLVGYSTGGFITLKYLTLHPQRLFSASATGMSNMPMNEENRAMLEKIGEALEERGDFKPLLDRLNIPTRGLSARIRMWGAGRINDTKALSYVIRSFPAFEVSPEQLAANTIPTLTLVGTDDPIAANAEEMHTLMANHSLVWLKGGDKLSCLAMPEFCEALNQHIRQSTQKATQ